MYHKQDPRHVLKVDNRIPVNDIKEVHSVEFNDISPTINKRGSKSWLVRGEKFYLEYSSVVNEEEFEKSNAKDEYILLLPDKNTNCTIFHNNEVKYVEGYSIAIIQKGYSRIKFSNAGTVILLQSYNDMKGPIINESNYIINDKNVSDFSRLQPPEDIQGIQVYSLDIPKKEGRFGRIFRSTNFTISCLYPWEGPRDTKTLSPHSHYDFEQCSIAVDGRFTHHFRYPWVSDKTKWKEDEHLDLMSPSVTFIPPGVTHTSEATGSGNNEIIDIFSPPRDDFALEEGWVINEDKYFK